MNHYDRIMMVKAMEFIARQVNCDDVFDRWLTYGVGDGDILYGDFDGGLDQVEELKYYIEDDEFSELMRVFLSIMKDAFRVGGLVCDGVVSK